MNFGIFLLFFFVGYAVTSFILNATDPDLDDPEGGDYP